MPRKPQAAAGKSGEAPNGTAQYLAWFKDKQKSDVAADWTAVDGRWLSTAAAAIGLLGGAIRFGYTRDGGAYAIGLYVGDEHHTQYLKPDENVEEFLKSVIEQFAPHLL